MWKSRRYSKWGCCGRIWNMWAAQKQDEGSSRNAAVSQYVGVGASVRWWKTLRNVTEIVSVWYWNLLCHVGLLQTGRNRLRYITCYLLDAFVQRDLHTQYCGQSPQDQFGVKCLAQGHTNILTGVGVEPVTPWSEHQRTNPLRHTPPFNNFSLF